MKTNTTRLVALLVSTVLFFNSCSTSKDYGILFSLNEDEKSVLTYLNDNNISNSIEESNRQRVFRVKNLNYKGMEFNTVRIAIPQKEIAGIEYRVHEKDNITNVLTYLKQNYGEATINPYWTKDCFLCKMYWGDSTGNYILAEECSDDYYKVFFMDGNAEYASSFFDKMVYGKRKFNAK